jgi:hypothetical protein
LVNVSPSATWIFSASSCFCVNVKLVVSSSLSSPSSSSRYETSLDLRGFLACPLPLTPGDGFDTDRRGFGLGGCSLGLGTASALALGTNLVDALLQVCDLLLQQRNGTGYKERLARST